MSSAKLEGELLRRQDAVIERFERLYAAHGAEALRFAHFLTGDKALAEDIAQDAFVRVLGKFRDLRSESAFRPYLLRTVLNLSRSNFRRRRLEERWITSTHTPACTLPDIETRDELMRALQRLPHRQRAALVLRYCEDLSEYATSEVLGTSVKAVKSLVARGLARLRENEGVSDGQS